MSHPMLLDPPWVAAHLPQLTGGLIPRSVHSYLAGVEKWLVPTILRAGLGLALGLAARLAEVLRRREIQLDAARPPTARPPPSGSLTGWSVPACRFPVHQKGGNSAKKCSKKFAPQERFTSSPNNSAPGARSEKQTRLRFWGHRKMRKSRLHNQNHKISYIRSIS